MLTDEHEHAMKVAEQAYSAGNLVTCDGYYEFDLDAAAAAVIAADRAGLVARIAELDGLLAEAYVYCDPSLDDDDANDFMDRLRAALKDTRHD